MLEAFIAAGFLTPEEAGEQPSAPPSLASLDDDQLLREVRARMKGAKDAGDAEAEKIAGPGDEWPRAAREGDAPKADE